MWKDINGKTGYKGMQGNTYWYGNMKHLSVSERAASLDDGITTYTAPVRPPLSASDQLLKEKSVKSSEVKYLFEKESLKSEVVAGVTYNGGYDSSSRIDSARRLVDLQAGNTITVYDIDNIPKALNVAQVRAVVLALGQKYQDLFAIKQGLLVDIKNAVDSTELEAVVIPWT